MTNSPTFLSQGVDHLGFLNGQLRGLMGYTALANELTQNADDAKAKSLVLDVTDDALILENDSMFTECQTVDQKDCSFELLAGHLCDFHRFRRVSSGNKREEENTIGAFGIGFTSVYQITDRPELFSGTRHWIIRPEETETQRIEQRIIDGINFTRFRLPWARNPNSRLRKALSVASISDKQIDQLFEDFEKSILDTIMFLKNIKRIELRRKGKTVKEVIIERNSDRLVVTDGHKTYQWLLYKGDFADKKSGLGNSHIVHNRKTEISIAVPLNNLDTKGLLFAYLPTQETVGLPFHINADFFPTPDRKRILFDDDYQGDWNRLAIEEAADVLSDQLEELTGILGPTGFWKLIEDLQKVSKAAENNQYDEIFGEFWETAKDKLYYVDCIYTSKEEWVSPSDAFILQNYKKEKPVIPVLEELDLNIVHEDLAKFYNILRGEDVGVEQFGLPELAKALIENDLDELTAIDDAPEWLRNDENHTILADEIKYLLAKTNNNEKEREEIRGCAIAKTYGGNFDTPDTIYKCKESVRTLFFALKLKAYFLDDNNPPPITDLVENFDIQAAISILEKLDPEKFTECFEQDSDAFIKVIEWLVNQCLDEDDETKERLRKLKIWVSDGELFALDQLVVPGGFTDPLHLASIVDLKSLPFPADRLIGIGAKKLTFSSYVNEQLPAALRKGVSPEKRKLLVDLFAKQYTEIYQNQNLIKTIASFEIIECQNGEFRAANSLYFSSDLTKRLISSKKRFVDPAPSFPFQIRELYKVLGIAEEPRIHDLLTEIDEKILLEPDEYRRSYIRTALVYLGEKYRDIENKSLFESLKRKKWLPAENDHATWFHPDQLYSPFQKNIFETTGKFIDLPRGEANRIAEFLNYLGVNRVPTPNLVVNHMKNMIGENTPVKQDIYDFFEQNYDDQWVKELCSTSCILISDHGYVSADKVFWAEPGFGVFRHRLSDEMRKYANFLSLLGVKDTPDYRDAISVLIEIAEEFADDSPVDEEIKKVIHRCWDILNEAPADDLENLRVHAVVLTNSNRLETPENIYFEDFPGIAELLGLAQCAIKLPPDTWQPMHAAGVKLLTEVVKINLVEADNQAVDDKLTQKMKWAFPCIVRVVEASLKDSEFDFETEHLRELSFVRTDKLLIKYSIPELNRFSETINEEAYFDAENQTLFYQSGNSNKIFREIARSICSQADTGGLTLSIKEIFSAENFEEATRILDDAGFASVDISKVEQASSATVSSFGEVPEEVEDEFVEQEDDFGEFFDEETEEEIKEEIVLPPPAPSGYVDGLARQFGANLGRETDASKTGEGEMPLPAQTNNGQSNGSSTQRTGHSSGGNHQGGERYKSNAPSPGRNSESQPAQKKPATDLPKAKGRLRSYLENNSSEQATRSENQEKSQLQLKTSAAGVQKVLEFEEAQGRDPFEMGHSNKGYDIKSMKDGKVVRYIEVKSTDGAWDLEGVKLTVDQYQRCIDEGDRFWLYVVEWANAPEKANIYCIQNPAAQVTDYCFDVGWKSLDKK